MLIRLLLLLTVVPLLELTLLLLLADVTGFKTTLAVVLGTGLLGAWLLRRQGLRTMSRIREELSAQRLPSGEMLDGVLLIMAGTLLLTPGVLTDLLGIALLIPWSRAWFRGWLVAWFKSRFRLTTFGSHTTPGSGTSEVIDSYVVRKDDDPAIR